MITYQITTVVDVHDRSGLLLEALDHAVLNDGMALADAQEMLCPDGDIDVGACLIMILDPGTSPHGTSIRSTTAQGVWASCPDDFQD